ncbi:hypothetical protein V8D89_002649 [Ganoderma adspersum]
MADLTFNETRSELANSDFLVVITSCTITTLLIYDHVLTLGREVTYIWSRGWSRSCILFSLLRYTTLFYAILLVFFHGTFPGLPIAAKYVTEMAQWIQATIVISTTRFMLDLHEAANPQIDTEMSRVTLSLGWGIEREDDGLSSFQER